MPHRRPYNPRSIATSGLAIVPVRSPLLGESLLFSFPPGTEMFHFPGFALSSLCIQPERTSRSRVSGLPHSEIHGSKPVSGSPWLIAAVHVLHRLSSPRHPPRALRSLTISLRRVHGIFIQLDLDSLARAEIRIRCTLLSFYHVVRERSAPEGARRVSCSATKVVLMKLCHTQLVYHHP